MTPHKDAGQGSFLVDLRLGKLGRYKAASGTTDPRLFSAVVHTIRALRDQFPPRYDVLAQLLRRELTPLELHYAFTHGTLGELETADERQRVSDLRERWLRSLDRSATTIADYRLQLETLGDVMLRELPTVLADRRAAAMASGKRTMFNHFRIAVRMLLKGTLGKEHRLFAAVSRVEALRVNKRKGNPQSVEAIRGYAQAMGPQGLVLWALCLSGMRRDEYFGRRWRVLSDRIVIAGTKTDAAERDAPLIYPLAQPISGHHAFGRLLSRVTNRAVRIHDLRYTYQRWCEDAGVPAVRIDWYLGHAVRDVSELYRRGRGFTEYLAKDAERVREWLGDPPSQGLALAR